MEIQANAKTVKGKQLQTKKGGISEDSQEEWDKHLEYSSNPLICLEVKYKTLPKAYTGM
jgi:hypothetical protein